MAGRKRRDPATEAPGLEKTGGIPPVSSDEKPVSVGAQDATGPEQESISEGGQVGVEVINSSSRRLYEPYSRTYISPGQSCVIHSDDDDQVRKNIAQINAVFGRAALLIK